MATNRRKLSSAEAAKAITQAFKKYDEFWTTPIDKRIEDYLTVKSKDRPLAYARLVRQLQGQSPETLANLLQFYSARFDVKQQKWALTSSELMLLAILHKENAHKKSAKERETHAKEAWNLSDEALARAALTTSDALGAYDVKYEMLSDGDTTAPPTYKQSLLMESAAQNSAIGLAKLSDSLRYGKKSKTDIRPKIEIDAQIEQYRRQAAELGWYSKKGSDSGCERLANGDIKGLRNILDEYVLRGRKVPLEVLNQLSIEAVRRNENHEVLCDLATQYQALMSDEDDPTDLKKDPYLFKKALQLFRAAQAAHTGSTDDYKKNIASLVEYIHPEKSDQVTEPLYCFWIYHCGMVTPQYANLFRKLATENPTLFDELLREDSVTELEAKLPKLLGEDLAKEVMERNKDYLRKRSTVLGKQTGFFQDIKGIVDRYEMDESHDEEANQLRMAKQRVEDTREPKAGKVSTTVRQSAVTEEHEREERKRETPAKKREFLSRPATPHARETEEKKSATRHQRRKSF